MPSDGIDPSIDDLRFLASSSHRLRVLDLLADGSSERAALREATGASPQTMGRILHAFANRRWLERDGQRYRLTPLGAYVHEHVRDVCGALATERKLRDVWEWLPREIDGFGVDLFADAVVSYPGPGYPYEPVERLTHLITSTDRLRGFGTTILKSVNNETMCRAVLDGMYLEYVFSPEALRATVAWNPALVAQTAACEHCHVFVHDSLPDEDRCGLGISDTRVGICCNDRDTRLLRAVVDTDAPKARQWALEVFDQYRNEATPVDAHTLESVTK